MEIVVRALVVFAFLWTGEYARKARVTGFLFWTRLLRTQDLPPLLEENSCLYIFRGEGWQSR